MAFRQKWFFGRKELFWRKDFSAKNTFSKFEMAFWPERLTYNLFSQANHLFTREFYYNNSSFKWICLTSLRIERFGSPLMTESFQACWHLKLKSWIHNILPFSTCCEKLWLINVASSAKFLGEFRLLPSSCGGSAAVSLTVSRSVKKKTLFKQKIIYMLFLTNKIFQSERRLIWIIWLVDGNK